MKTKQALVLLLAIIAVLLSACTPVDDSIDCDLNPTHEDCQLDDDPVDCDLTRNHEDCDTDPTPNDVCPHLENIDDWEAVWCDEFDYVGLPDNTKWNYDVGGHGWGNNEKQFYTNADTLNAKLNDGSLLITARASKTGDKEFSSARISTKHKGDWKYGKIDVRAKLPKGRGLWPAIWMLPSESVYGGWPRSGEIDIMEFVGYAPDTIFQTVHTKSFNHILGTQVGKSTKVDSIGDNFHNYGIIWDSEKILFFIDGRNTHQFLNKNQTSAEWPFDQEFHLILNLAVGGNWGGKFGIDDSIFPSQFEIDYVRVYKK